MVNLHIMYTDHKYYCGVLVVCEEYKYNIYSYLPTLIDTLIMITMLIYIFLIYFLIISSIYSNTVLQYTLFNTQKKIVTYYVLETDQM